MRQNVQQSVRNIIYRELDLGRPNIFRRVWNALDAQRTDYLPLEYTEGDVNQLVDEEITAIRQLLEQRGARPIVLTAPAPACGTHGVVGCEECDPQPPMPPQRGGQQG